MRATIDRLNSMERMEVIYPKIGTIIDIERKGYVHSLKSNIKVHQRAKIIDKDKRSNTATLAMRDLFSQTPKITIIDYMLGVETLTGKHYHLFIMGNESIGVNNEQYWIYDKLLGDNL